MRLCLRVGAVNVISGGLRNVHRPPPRPTAPAVPRYAGGGLNLPMRRNIPPDSYIPWRILLLMALRKGLHPEPSPEALHGTPPPDGLHLVCSGQYGLLNLRVYRLTCLMLA